MSNKNQLLLLFLRCLSADYTHTSEGGDYAIEWEPYQHRLYIMFEWSDGQEDWRNNLNFFAKTVNPDAPKNERWSCHRGFLKVWNAMKDEVMRKIREMAHQVDIRQLTCIGYSHGAALALLATEEIAHRSAIVPRIEGYGFGCPRVVWGALPESVEHRLSNFHTVRNIPDLITHLPPVTFGFRHVGLKTIGQKGKYTPIEAHTAHAYMTELGGTPQVAAVKTAFAYSSMKQKHTYIS